MFRNVLLPSLSACLVLTAAAQRDEAPLALAREELARTGFNAEDLQGLVIRDQYRDAHNGVQHTWMAQRWQGIEIWNAQVAVHQRADGTLMKLDNGAWNAVGGRVNATSAAITADAALALVLGREGYQGRLPARVAQDAAMNRWLFDGAAFNGEEPFVQLVYQPAGDRLALAWNVNWYAADGSHWWNVRIDANTGRELERNDWVVNCAFDHAPAPEDHPAPAAPNDYRVYPSPVESPNFGARSLVNAPWTLAPNASPFGWHDTDGSAGPEHTITRGNNVWAQEDANGNNGTGYSPSSGTLDFDFPIDLAQAPSTYQDAAITNLFHWNNIMHDIWYQYGFDEPSGNFQSNNYGNGGAGSDWVNADAQDGSGSNNANFGTPADGSNPRMQMFLWTAPTPDRDGDLDNGIICHEYGHGISNRLVGGPMNVNCLSNAEQMGEGWSDWFGLMLTMEAGDAGADARGIGTYALNQAPTGTGIRPAPYSTSFGVNSYTYGSTNNTSLAAPHGIGFVWCTILWEVTWELINAHGFSPDLYNAGGTAGNQIAMRLVTDGLKLTPCNPGFVGARDAILAADQATYGGAHLNLLWAAFARRGLGFSADQGSASSRTDQTEAFNLPVNNSVNVKASLAPREGSFFACDNPTPVILEIRNTGMVSQSNFPVSYRLDGGSVVTQTFTGPLASGAVQSFTFSTPITITGLGAHTLKAWTSLPGDQFVGDDSLVVGLTVVASSPTPFLEDVQSGLTTPPGWRMENPDGSYGWTTASLTNGPDCTPTIAWMIDHYYYGGSGQEDLLYSPPVMLGDSSRLKFDHAHATYSSSYVDGFRVDLSDDCGDNWTTVYSAFDPALATAPATTNVYEPANCSQWLAHDIDISAFDGEEVMLRFVSINGYGNQFYLDNVQVESSGVRVALKLLLQGAYDTGTGLMRDDLRTAGLIPLLEPYTAAGFTQAAGGGDETTTAAVLATTGPDAIVDWVLVELRDQVDPSILVATRCALVQRDGDVVATDGSSAVLLLATADQYHVAVRHRNHLGAMTAAPVALNGPAATVDFTLGTTPTWGTAARTPMAGVMALWMGNAFIDEAVKYTGIDNDRDEVLLRVGGTVPTAVANGYWPEDCTMDGEVKYTGLFNDRDPILLNIGGAVPTAIRQEQLP